MDGPFRGGFFLSHIWFALGAGFGRPVWRWSRLIISMVRRRCRFWALSKLNPRNTRPLPPVRTRPISEKRGIRFDRELRDRKRKAHPSLVSFRCWFWAFRLAAVSRNMHQRLTPPPSTPHRPPSNAGLLRPPKRKAKPGSASVVGFGRRVNIPQRWDIRRWAHKKRTSKAAKFGPPPLPTTHHRGILEVVRAPLRQKSPPRHHRGILEVVRAFLRHIVG